MIDFKIVDGILYGPYPEGIELNLELVKRAVSERKAFLEGKVLPGLVDTTSIKSATKEARDYLATPSSSEGLAAVALVSNSKFTTFITNFFIKISLIKAPIPICQFTKESDALEWLQQFK